MFGKKRDDIEEEEEVKQSMPSKAEISLLLKTYDDIFSSFDPRPYTQKALSDDFLIEEKRAARDKIGEFELRFLIPKKARVLAHEELIKKRLREHFRKHHLLIEQEVSLTKKKGIWMTILGISMITLAAYISSLNFERFFMHFLIILLEPAGWFTAWTGLDQIYYTVDEKKPDLEFYRKMTKADIVFASY